MRRDTIDSEAMQEEWSRRGSEAKAAGGGKVGGCAC